ncbi:MAG: hypothetical protein J3K34DRAFT_406289 [Monoraphidium minutum]|nr:MAG: hypothetical protein J3K34DRAFT_406289 [Monoraphidium minutum]
MACADGRVSAGFQSGGCGQRTRHRLCKAEGCHVRRARGNSGRQTARGAGGGLHLQVCRTVGGRWPGATAGPQAAHAGFAACASRRPRADEGGGARRGGARRTTRPFAGFARIKRRVKRGQITRGASARLLRGCWPLAMTLDARPAARMCFVVARACRGAAHQIGSRPLQESPGPAPTARGCCDSIQQLGEGGAKDGRQGGRGRRRGDSCVAARSRWAHAGARGARNVQAPPRHQRPPPPQGVAKRVPAFAGRRPTCALLIALALESPISAADKWFSERAASAPSDCGA